MAMEEAVILSAVRTPIGRYAGSLKDVRPDDLAALVIAEAVRLANIDADSIEDVILGCANQAGEDNRNVARMALLLAGLPLHVAGQTVNRLCGSGLQAVNSAAQAIQTGMGETFVAGGVESMTRAPFVLGKSDSSFSRNVKFEDTTLGWRFVNPKLSALHHPYSMGETAENVAARYDVSRADQLGLRPRARIVASAVAGVDPAFMGLGPISATRKVLARTGLSIKDIDLIELNEAFAVQALQCARELEIDEEKLNVNGGAIALGHPLGCSGARLIVTLLHELERRGGRYGLATMCIGVGQGIATIIERM